MTDEQSEGSHVHHLFRFPDARPDCLEQSVMGQQMFSATN